MKHSSRALTKSTGFGQLLNGIFWNAFAVLGTKGLPFLQALVLTRFLSPDEFGSLSFVVAVYTTVSPIVDWGLAYSLQKQVAESDNKDSTILLAFVMRVILSMIVGGICWSMDVRGHVFRGYGFYVFLWVVFSSFQVPLFALNAQLLYWQGSILTFSLGLWTVLLTFAGIWMGLRIIAPLWAQALAFLLVGGIGMRLALRHFTLRPDQWRREWFDILKFGFSVMIIGTLTAFTPQVGLIVITYLRGVADTAVLRVASLLTQPLTILGSVVLLPFLPLASTLHTRRMTVELSDLVGKIFRYLLLLGVPCILGGMALAVPLIVVGGGELYRDGALAFRWLLVASLMTMFFTALSSVPLMADGVRFLTFTVGLQAFLALILTIVLVLYWGLIGAAVALIIANVAGLALLFRWFVQHLPFQLEWYRYINYLVAGLIMALVVWLLDRALEAYAGDFIRVSVGIGVGGLMYGTMLLTTGAVSRSEISQLRGLVGKQGI